MTVIRQNSTITTRMKYYLTQPSSNRGYECFFGSVAWAYKNWFL